MPAPTDPPPASADLGPTPTEDPWREPVRGGYPDPRLFSLSGAEQLRTMLTGQTARPPISRLTGMRLVEIGTGEATFEMPLSEWLCAPQGSISIGPLTMPADAAMGCAVQSALPPATPFTTSELSLRLLGPVGAQGSVIARSTLIQARRTIALAEVSITNAHGRMIAHGSSLCFIQPAVTPAPEPPGKPVQPAVTPAPEPPGRPTPPNVAQAPQPPAEPPRQRESAIEPTPDPWRCPPQGRTLAQEIWESMSGLEILAAQLQGELPAPPIHHLTGLTLTSAGENEATFAMPASEWLCAPAPRRVQGGAVALLAETALSAAIQTTLPRATALAPVDLKVNYLRPLAADGRLAVGRGRVVHSGRRIAVANAEVLDADGKPVAVATGSAMVLPGRPASLGSVEN